jgi:hypothetical protein
MAFPVSWVRLGPGATRPTMNIEPNKITVINTAAELSGYWRDLASIVRHIGTTGSTSVRVLGVRPGPRRLLIRSTVTAPLVHARL